MTTSAPEQVIIDALNAAHAVIYEHNSCHSSHCEKNGCMGENMCPQGQHRKLLLQIDMALAALRDSSQRNPNTAVVGDPKAWNGDEVVRVELAGERGNKAGPAFSGSLHAEQPAPSSGSLPNTSGPASAAALVAEQATDPGLWFIPSRASEDYLQAALRELHAAVEGEKP